MKALIQKLSSLTEQQIRNFTIVEATLCLENFNNLSKAATAIWELFKLFDTDTRDERTLVIMNNHAKGVVLEQVKKLKAMSSRFSSMNLVDETKLPELEKYQTMASDYLEYNQHKIALTTNQSLVQTRIIELSPVEEKTTCKMQ